MKISSVFFLAILAEVHAFQTISGSHREHGRSVVLHAEPSEDHSLPSRRSFSLSLAQMFSVGLGAMAAPEGALAGIDVSGLRVEGSSSGNSNLPQQLKAYDGSGTTRVNEIKALQTTSQPSIPTLPQNPVSESVDEKVAHWAYRANPGFGPSLSRSGPFLYLLNDSVVPPKGSKLRSVGVQFKFPADWLQLDKFTGGLQYVDQRNGDKLYLLQASLPDDYTLGSLPKNVLGDLIFDPQGSVARTGSAIDEYKVVNGQTLVECPDGGCATRRRFKIKYATITGNGLRVERRGLVDAYQVENEIYMLMTSSNAVKFEKKESLERETVENIVASFALQI